MNLGSNFIVFGQKLVMAANLFLSNVTAQHSWQKNRTILAINSAKNYFAKILHNASK
jgi:hypothetical protein